MSWNDLPGLGTATGTRVDSAAKHIMACKMDTKLLQAMLEDNTDPQNALHNEKMKYCMHKDEIVLNTTNTDQNIVTAYPMVVTTLGDVHDFVTTVIAKLYSKEDATAFYAYQNSMKTVKDDTDMTKLDLSFKPSDPDEKKDKQRMQVRILPDFRCQGVALGQAWASYLSGDNVASVLVGGMVTVQNGHFVMHTGDLVQWYFDFEKFKFDQSNTKSAGRRIAKQTKDPTRNDKRERYMDERLFGNSAKTGKTAGQKNTNNIVRIKSYKMHYIGDDNSQLFVTDHYGDKIRIFAKCISGGRPFDAVDIMLMTQSL